MLLKFSYTKFFIPVTSDVFLLTVNTRIKMFMFQCCTDLSQHPHFAKTKPDDDLPDNII